MILQSIECFHIDAFFFFNSERLLIENLHFIRSLSEMTYEAVPSWLSVVVSAFSSITESAGDLDLTSLNARNPPRMLSASKPFACRILVATRAVSPL